MQKTMKACVLRHPAPIETNPLEYTDVPQPAPSGTQVLVRVNACGICRTDLHVIEGELAARKSPITPGHQVVGVVEAVGESAQQHAIGTRVGIAWLHSTDGTCEFCRAKKENLCDNPAFTGWTVDGGYAEYALAEESFVYPIPDGFDDLKAAPLLCAGIIGFRALRLSGIERGGRLGLYGFGAAAHVAIQVARHWGAEVYAATRDQRHQKLALELGAVWAGGTVAEPPVKLDSAIIFAPAGEIVPAALKALKKGGTLALGGIHMSAIPPLDYDLLYQERVVRSVANNTRADGHDFLKVAAEIPVHISTEVFRLEEANRALNLLKNDAIRGAAVLQIR
ncbi:MAG TPA: zinc-dependent alcohol dehydrogenase family protein [Bryobacteraceae bacterium]|jgi:propanol-preferring alcohol dehydrogenase|nr:zinc-dependent alcohol dehydrogenase family protein [Bryobacteraceae bacterium]